MTNPARDPRLKDLKVAPQFKKLTQNKMKPTHKVSSFIHKLCGDKKYADVETKILPFKMDI